MYIFLSIFLALVIVLIRKYAKIVFEEWINMRIKMNVIFIFVQSVCPPERLRVYKDS